MNTKLIISLLLLSLSTSTFAASHGSTSSANNVTNVNVSNTQTVQSHSRMGEGHQGPTVVYTGIPVYEPLPIPNPRDSDVLVPNQQFVFIDGQWQLVTQFTHSPMYNPAMP